MLIIIINGLLIILLLLCAAIDIRKKEIPVSMLVVLGVTAILYFFGNAEGKWEGSIRTFAEGMIPGILLLGAAKASKENIGCGDGIVLMEIGGTAGIGKCMFILAIALAFAGVFSLGMIVIKKVGRNYKIPFIPFLAMAYLLSFIPAVINGGQMMR